MNPSEAAFEIVTPSKLKHWIGEGTLSIGHLTLALEVYGKKGTPGTTAFLMKFLLHEQALVREGAIVGLQRFWAGRKFLYDGQVHLDVLRGALIDVMCHDPSPGVRHVAQEALQEEVADRLQ